MSKLRNTAAGVLLSMFLAVLLATFSSGSIAAAQPTPPPAEGNISDFLQKTQDAVTYPEVTGEDRDILKNSAVTEVQRTGVHLQPGDSLDFDSQMVKVLPEGTYVVSIPIRGPTVPHGASVAVLFDSDFVRTGMIENQLHSISDTSGTVQSWVDGELIYDETVTAENATADDSDPQARGMNWGKLNSCLASAGVPAWVAAGLSNICAIACLITAGAGCVICIAGVIGFSGGVVYACVERAWE